MQIRFAVAAVLGALSAGQGLAAADLHTAAGLMPGCRNFLADNNTSLLVQGMCFGEVTALFETFAGKCAPPDLPGQQLMRTVVDYIDRLPSARLNEPFNHLAIEAMTKTWPCKQP
jgi:Rap1a immunity proteins